MKMSDLWRAWGLLKWLPGLIGMSMLPLATVAGAQESEADEGDLEEEIQSSEDEEDVEDVTEGKVVEELTVTGSRFRRDPYNAIAPLQVIDAEVSREGGQMDAAGILQESTAASGQQVDLSFGGGDLTPGLGEYVLDEGPGASTINLRGLSPDRALVLINGRRLAPAGVEGAPSNPDLNMIVPASLVDRFEVLLDGASSVYGSDAIAGVVNVILRDDFEGLTLDTHVKVNQFNGNMNRVMTASWGRNFEKGFVGVGSSWSVDPVVRLDDSPFGGECEVHYERDEDGNLRTKEASLWERDQNMRWGDCLMQRTYASIYFEDLGSMFFAYWPLQYMWPTDGFTNVGIPGFSTWRLSFLSAYQFDSDGDGWSDISIYDHNTNGKTNQTLYPEFDRRNIMGYGEYSFGGEWNLSPYFEAQIARRKSYSDSDTQIFRMHVPAENPWNLCNPDGFVGVDCISPLIPLVTEPGPFHDAVVEVWGELDDPYSWCTFLGAWFGYGDCLGYLLKPTTSYEYGDPIRTQQFWNVRGDRTETIADVEQKRLVAGIRLDLPFMDVLTLKDWTVDASAIRSVARGDSSRPGIRLDRMAYSLGWYNHSAIPCYHDPAAHTNSDDPFLSPLPGLYGFGSGSSLWPLYDHNEETDEYTLRHDVVDGCVAVRPFARSLFPYGDEIVGDFSTPEEREYLFDSRDFQTDIYQDTVSVFLIGEMMELPGGPVYLSFGADYRKDEINSMPDNIARDGLFYNFLDDGGAVGARDLLEYFMEMEMPLFAGGLLREELSLNLSARNTDDEFFPSKNTWSVKLGWRPIDSVLIRGTRGTSYRTPNLRNLFLEGSTGTQNLNDVCFIPWVALTSGEYNEDQDNRSDDILDNCRNAGVDPIRARTRDGWTNYATEVSTGGTFSLDPETSVSETLGIVFSQPFTDDFDLTVALSYYDIEVSDTILETTLAFVFADCYGGRPGPQNYCDRFTRVDDPETVYYDPKITHVQLGFINRDVEQTRGFDINMSFRDEYEAWGLPIRFTIDLTSHRLLERLTEEDSAISAQQAASQEPVDTHADWGFNRWKHRVDLAAEVYDYRVLWTTRILSPVSAPSEDFWDIAPYVDTCWGPPDDVRCRDVSDAPRYFMHSASFNYKGDRISLGVGMYNVLNVAPPLVDWSEAPNGVAVNNRPLGVGYDFLGRSFFVNMSYRFNGG